MDINLLRSIVTVLSFVLFIGIVFLTVFFFFKNKVTKMTLSMNLQAVDLLKNMAMKSH